ncbi:DegT/DnrJ/EryC1/StrS family aminotransferase [Albibacterium bauzanense]|uniref:dTDP-4-amino-4,6-dideoxygalactose transaminase n=1 Tax=Albibacterium bauzanense TaxID=653929 RepID=A0A4R1M0U8_9SPHI|nr:aminotransferase class I/II-fold pyridoxal phosphate-dependent enzyme [Albibacterium bauzanense]TCK84917.1 dTDP-4-amino-4,6-dideoxygalactose transaminase [Albibacterium bauzanense]
MFDKIWLSSPHMGDEEFSFVKNAFDANWIAPTGPDIIGFEKDLESYLENGVHVTTVSSGTAAIHLALLILGVKDGDEVICQSLTFVATANPILYLGAKPVFVDSEKDTFNMSPELLERAILDRISKGIKPKAIIVVHLYGNPAKIVEIMEIARRYDILVVEDAAEALGSSYKNQALGTFGDFGVLSFNGNKIITTSGGGALISKNKEWIDKAYFYATQARDNEHYYQHSEMGYNYRMSNICAAIGRGQMTVLNKRVAQRRANFYFYKEKLKEFKSFHFIEESDRNSFSNHWLSVAVLNGIDPNIIRLKLQEVNIESRFFWKPMHLQPLFEKYDFYGDGTSEYLFERGICLPSGSSLTQTQKNFLVQNLKGILKEEEVNSIT